MIKVVGYCRVSTEKDDQVNSFRSQKQYFDRYIRDHPGWEFYGIYADEGITGTSTKKRSQFNRMMADAYEGRFHLIVTKEVSRFSRNILDTIAYTRELRAIGIGVIFLEDRIHTLEAEGEMLLSFLASLAQEESRRTSSRVVWGQTRQMEKGVVFGQSLLGYDVKDGVLTVNEEGAEIVRLIFHKYAEEQAATAEIARFLTAQGYRTCRGSTKWRPNTVIKILNNEKYVGDLVQKKTYTPDFLTHEKKINKGEVPFVILPDHHEAIVSREVWDLAHQRMQRNNKRCAGEGRHSDRYVFSGKIRCGVCGAPYVGRTKCRKDGSKLRRWSCATVVRDGAKACGVGKLIRDDDAVQMLKTAVKHLPMARDAIIRNVTELAFRAIRAEEYSGDDELRRLQSEIEQVQRKKEAVMDSYFSREISKEDMQVMKGRYDAQTEVLCRRQAEAELRRQESADLQGLRESIRTEVAAVMNCDRECEVFYKRILNTLTVYADRRMELRLQFLPHVFCFAE